MLTPETTLQRALQSDESKFRDDAMDVRGRGTDVFRGTNHGRMIVARTHVLTSLPRAGAEAAWQEEASMTDISKQEREERRVRSTMAQDPSAPLLQEVRAECIVENVQISSGQRLESQPGSGTVGQGTERQVRSQDA